MAGSYDCSDPGRRQPFLRPSDRLGVLVSGGSPTAVRQLSRLVPRDVVRLPELLPLRMLGIDPSGAPAKTPPIITSVPPPHLSVAFVLQRLEHAVVSGGGVASSIVFWEGSSPATTVALAGPYGWPLPEAGESTVIPSDHPAAIYQALRHDGCSSATLSFPITLERWVTEDSPASTEIGRITLADDDTLTQGGLCDFHYVIRCEGSNGGVSDFTVSGLVYVHCTNETDLG